MNQYKKSLVGSVIALMLGTSCCWVSAIAIWLGGVALSGLAVKLIDDAQIMLIGIGFLLLLITAMRYYKLKKITK